MSFDANPVIVDRCFDDHQWWLLGWAQRAAAVFEYVATSGWNESTCGGGVTWCPPPTSPYKNAITVELFISSAMALALHESVLSQSSGYYVAWALKAWNWLEASGMINTESLINDGLDGTTCKNNGQTTWTYNQGVLLSGLGALSAATGNTTIATVAQRIARAAMRQLVIDGVLVEPCGGGMCGGDGQIFKGIFVRHLGRLARGPSVDGAFRDDVTAWLKVQADALLGDTCGLAGEKFPFRWGGPCDVVTTATSSAALDALNAAGAAGAASSTSWPALGLGNCADGVGQSMPNCFSASPMTERACRDAAWVTEGAVAYDFSVDCAGGSFCRIRTLSGASACAGGWMWEGGAATTVATATGTERTVCVVRRQ